MTTTDDRPAAELSVRERHTGALALTAEQDGWNDRQVAAFRQIGIEEAPEAERQVFLHVCQRTGLDPFARQVYMIGRYDRKANRTKYTIQTGIDGFRVIAERRPEYAGQTEIEWCDDDGRWSDVWLAKGKAPRAARVGVYRHDWARPVYATVMFDEFKVDSPMWSLTYGKPAHMIGKVAEAHALRKAFPQDLSGLYTDDEMAAADRDATRPRYDHSPAAGTLTTAQLTGQVLDALPVGPEQAPAEQGTAPAPREPEPEQAAPAAGPAGRAAANATNATGARPEPARITAYMRLVREAEVNRMDHAAQVLERPVRGMGDLTADDVEALIANLTAALAAEDGDEE